LLSHIAEHKKYGKTILAGIGQPFYTGLAMLLKILRAHNGIRTSHDFSLPFGAALFNEIMVGILSLR